ncbi:MAG: HupE/UreJ family protein [Burkholderiaceae bacterium]
MVSAGQFCGTHGACRWCRYGEYRIADGRNWYRPVGPGTGLPDCIFGACYVTPAIGAAIVALFALFHGYAHGAEMPLLGSAWQYGMGFMVSTAGLHGVGLVLGKGMDKKGWLLRAVGAMVAASGAWMMSAI